MFIKIWALAQSMGGRSKLFLMVSGGEDKVPLIDTFSELKWSNWFSLDCKAPRLQNVFGRTSIASRANYCATRL